VCTDATGGMNPAAATEPSAQASHHHAAHLPSFIWTLQMSALKLIFFETFIDG